MLNGKDIFELSRMVREHNWEMRWHLRRRDVRNPHLYVRLVAALERQDLDAILSDERMADEVMILATTVKGSLKHKL